MSTINYLNDYNLYDFFENADSITIYNSNNKLNFKKNTPEFNELLSEFQDTIYNSYELPALSVSLHNETIQALKLDCWIEFNFTSTLSHNDLPFQSLLIQITPEQNALNIIRKQNSQYEGRCFYLNLDSTKTSLFNLITSKFN